MDKLYAAGREDTWPDEPGARADWKLANEVLAHIDPGTLLDVGCFNGGFLAKVNSTWQRFGIEINPAAAEKAKLRGATILGQDFQAVEGTFDAITAFDVIEHVADPAAFLRRMVQATAADGMVVISTGNTESFLWRLMKGNYWYCRFPEHISFISPSWCKRQARELGLTAEFHKFSRGEDPSWAALREIVANVIYRMLPAFRLIGLKPTTGRLGRLAREGPTWCSAKDHMVVIFRRIRLT